MAPLALIVAMAKNRVIGKDGGLPWRLPEDLRHFKAVTMGHAIVMGRKTHASIGRALPGRRNIVVTRTAGASFAGCETACSLGDAIAMARATDAMPMVIGGAQIYAEALPLATRLYLTEVHGDALGEIDGDAFFPPIDAGEWDETERRDGEGGDGVSFRTLERKRK